MGQYDIVFGILLVLSIIDFALVAPIPAQERCQTCIDVVHIPRNVIPVLEKRGDDELEKLGAYFEKWGLGDPHAPSISTANSDSLVEPSSPASTASSTFTPTSTQHGSDADFWNHLLNPEDPEYRGDAVLPADLTLPSQENMVADGHHVHDVQQPNLGQSPQENGVSNGHHVDDVQQQDPLVEPPSPLWSTSSESMLDTPPTSSDDEYYHESTWADPDSVSEGHYWVNFIEPGGNEVDDNIRLLFPQESGVASGRQVHNVQLPNPGLLPQENVVANGHQVHNVQLQNPGLLPQENVVANGHQVNNVQLPNPGLSPQDDVMANDDPVD